MSKKELIKEIKEIEKWVIKGEKGDPNGAKCYQALKRIRYLLKEIK